MDYTKKYTYTMLQNDLEIGHEIEFTYQDKRYSFSHNSNEWYLTEFDNPEYQVFNGYNNLLKFGKIQRKTIKQIWDEVIIEALF